jgi:CheY-like chemotaxis protein/HPt (histidine-containing phosphotransfer) domain-containing protein
MSILLAEDNSVNQKVALLMLSNLGYHADIASSGVEVLKKLERRHYDVILMDVQMPEMDGLEASRQIQRSFSAELRPWIIALTANALAEDRQRCLDAGMQDYISKPVLGPEIQQALQRYLLAKSNPTVVRELKPDIAPKADSSGADYWGLPETLEAFLEQGEEAVVLELMQLYLTSLREELKELEQNCSDANPDGVRRTLHQLRGSSLQIGAGALAKLAGTAEQTLVTTPSAIADWATWLPPIHDCARMTAAEIQLRYEEVVGT